MQAFFLQVQKKKWETDSIKQEEISLKQSNRKNYSESRIILNYWIINFVWLLKVIEMIRFEHYFLPI